MKALSDSLTLAVPARWVVWQAGDRALALDDLRDSSRVLATGAAALCGLYMRMCDCIRRFGFDDAEVRAAIGDALPPPRVSEMLRVANAPEDVYRRYRAGFFGFKAALERCRMYSVTASDRLRDRKIHRTAARLVLLADARPLTIRAGGCVVEVHPGALQAQPAFGIDRPIT
jgi:hypothetical protein